jgi:hypothetical protein
MTPRTCESDTTEAVWDEFLAVVFADQEWVRSEFDALIAAEWPNPPPRPATPPPRTSPRSTAGAVRARKTAPDLDVPRQPRWRRCRSPPMRSENRPRFPQHNTGR